MTALLDIDQLRAAYPLPSVVAGVVDIKRAGNEWKACCPLHSEKSPSFTIFDGGKRFHCFGCGAGGDVLDFLQALHSVDLRGAAAILEGGDLPMAKVPALPAANVRNERLPEARSIWRNSAPVAGTLAEDYLRGRGITMPLPESLRYAALRYGAGGREYPCLISAIVGPDKLLRGIQRTYLADDGKGKASLDKPKLSLGRISGGAIRLAPAAGELIVCEGLEDGLSVQQSIGKAVWVSAGTAMLPAMQFPPLVHSVTIAGDNDNAGRAAVEKAANVFAGRFLKVGSFFPAQPHKDFNQQLMEGAKQ